MPEATPKREAVRERMLEITWGARVSLAARLGERVVRDVCVVWTYLGVMLDGFLDYGGDFQFALGGHWGIW